MPTPRARTKIQTRLKERRVVYLSWVPDEHDFAKTCVTAFIKKLTPIHDDDFGVPLTVRDSRPAGTAGDVRVRPMQKEALHDVTDVVGVMSSEYLACNCAGDGRDAELVFFIGRKRDEGKAGEGPVLSLWVAPVETLKLDRYAVFRSTPGRWWHALIEQARFHIDKDQPETLYDEVAAAIDKVLGHRATQCGNCNGD